MDHGHPMHDRVACQQCARARMAQDAAVAYERLKCWLLEHDWERLHAILMHDAVAAGRAFSVVDWAAFDRALVDPAAFVRELSRRYRPHSLSECFQ
jgi:hypothetical protein